MHGSLQTAKDGRNATRLLHDPKRTRTCNEFCFANAHTSEAERTVAQDAEGKVRTTKHAEEEREMFSGITTCSEA